MNAMNFRTQTVNLFAMLLLLYLPRHTEAESLPKSLGESRPNIVLIISDDHAWMDYGFMGNERVHTPNLDALAAKAAQLPNSYVPSSVCRPSLASILTGLYPHQHGIHFNHGPPGNSGYNRIDSQTEYEKKRKIEFEWIGNHQLLPRVLHEKGGYRCLQTGKFWEGHFRNGGFTEGMTTFSPPDPTQTYGGIRTLANGVQVAHGNGDTGLKIGRETMEPIRSFIQDCENDATPWFVWYAPYLPHLPHDAPDSYWKLMEQRPGVLPWEKPYYASIAQFDSSVGELMLMVDELSDSQKTIFIFLADNGWRPSQNRSKNRKEEFNQTIRSKRAPFDDGVRTPMLICWEGVIPPQTDEGLASSVDIFPTLMSAAKIESSSPTFASGIDLFSLLQEGKEIPSDRSVYGEIYPGDATSLSNPEHDIAYRWIRKGKMKLIVPHPMIKTAPTAGVSHSDRGSDSIIEAWNGYVKKPSLFNLANDPYERLNLASSPLYQKQREDLLKRLNEWWTP